VYDVAHAENPRRTVNVVYSRKWIEAIAPLGPVGPQRTLAQLESDLAQAGIAYAIIEKDEQQAFARQLDDALSAARNT
jgi:hypothetical protein